MQIIYTYTQFLKIWLLTIFNGKNTSKINKKFIKCYDENCDKGNIFEVDVEYHKELHELHNDLLFLPEKINSVWKLVCNLYDNEKYVAHIRTLKQVLNDGLILKKCIKSLHLIRKLGGTFVWDEY